MALSSNEKELLNRWASVIESVGEDVCRYSFIKYTWPDLASKYLSALDRGQDAVTELINETRKEFVDKEWTAIDPFTAYDIVGGLFWPSIVAQDSAMVDHPSDERLSSMRGIPISWVFTDEGSNGNQVEIDVFFPKMFPGLLADRSSLFDDSVLDDFFGTPSNKNPVVQASRALYNALDQLVDNDESGLSAADQKEALSLLFKSELAAKLYWIYFGNKKSLGRPIETLRFYNPYLAYFCWTAGWQSGDRVMISHQIKPALEALIPNYFSTDSEDIVRESGAALLSSNPESALAKAVNVTNAAVEAQYKWLQRQKTDPQKKDYYNDWFARFFKNPKSLVNMIIIINEKVNFDLERKYTHTLKCREKLNKLGAAYQATFKINIGD
jgi:hypothetical protein